MFFRTTAINKLLKLKKRYKFVPGGTSAGKTYGIIPILIDKACKNKDLEISIVSENFPHLRRGARKDFIKIMKSTNRWNPNNWRETDSKYTFANGSYIEFFGADQADKLRGARRHILYVNEANNISFDAFDQLDMRTSREVWIDFNPSNEFWAHEEFTDDEDTDWLVLTYKDNECLESSIVKKIKKALVKGFFNPDSKDLFKESNIRNKYWANWWKVYGLGLLGQLEGAILQNWEFGEFNNDLPYLYGLDFGVRDPDALIKVAVDNVNKIIYLHEEIYQNNLSTDELGDVINSRNVGKKLIIADSQASRTIKDLKKCKHKFNIVEVSKNKILDDIKMLQGYRLVITKESTNLAKELRGWLWLDKKGEVPADILNHLLDAMRYAVQTYLSPKKKKGRQRAM
jgi:phage terminase large subunit